MVSTVDECISRPVKKDFNFSNLEGKEWDVENFKSILHPFQLGSSFYVVFDKGKNQIDFCGNRVLDVLGYVPSSITSRFLKHIIHPDDKQAVLDFEIAASQFLKTSPMAKRINYLIRYDYRVRSKAHGFKRLMCQTVTLIKNDGKSLYKTLVMFTDISFLKESKLMTLSILGKNGEPSYPNFKKANRSKDIMNPLTEREFQVLSLLSEGLSSKSIGEYLRISRNTVSNHRRNILRKANVKSTAGLLRKAFINAWV